MKTKLITIAAAVAATATSAVAQVNVAGWDFSSLPNAGTFLADGQTPVNNINANYTNGAADFNGAAALGSFVFDGSLGSDNIDIGFGTQDVFAAANATVNTTANLGYLGVGASINALNSQGQTNLNPFNIGFRTNESFVLAADLTSLNSIGDGWAFSFGAATFAGSAAIDWEYSTNGTDYFSAGVTSNITTAALQQDVDLTGIAALDGQSQVFFRGTISGLTSDLIVDNFSVDANNVNVVPEPSTYAAIAGALALAFVAYRRRS